MVATCASACGCRVKRRCACHCIAHITQQKPPSAAWQETGTEEARRRLAVFVPAFERMVALVRGHVRLPDNWDALHSDEQKEFKRNRFAVGDTLLDAASAPLAFLALH